MGNKPGDFKADPVFLKTARNMTSLASNNLPNELALAVYSFNNKKKWPVIMNCFSIDLVGLKLKND